MQCCYSRWAGRGTESAGNAGDGDFERRLGAELLSDFIDFRDQLKLFDGIAVAHVSLVQCRQEDHAERAWGELVSGISFRFSE